MAGAGASACAPGRSRSLPRRISASTAATAVTVSMRPRRDPTEVRGSVSMKKTSSWYMGPVRGATSAWSGVPVTRLRRQARATKAATYVAETCSTRARQTTVKPKTQITALVARSFPNSWLRMATRPGASSSSAAIAKLLGFHRCRPPARSTYFEPIASTGPTTNGHQRPACGRSRMARLMPEM